MACRLGRLLDPYLTALSFVYFPLLDACAPAPLALTHCHLGVYVSVWCDPPSVASTGSIFKCFKIETFVATWVLAIDACIDQLKHIGLIEKVL
jgi:hypothetical protein